LGEFNAHAGGHIDWLSGPIGVSDGNGIWSDNRWINRKLDIAGVDPLGDIYSVGLRDDCGSSGGNVDNNRGQREYCNEEYRFGSDRAEKSCPTNR
jgi:hypothetical protein